MSLPQVYEQLHFIDRIIIPWFQKKVVNIPPHLSLVDAVRAIPELESEVEKSRRAEEWRNISKELEIISFRGEEKKKLLLFVEEGLKEYCLEFLSLLKSNKRENLSLRLVYSDTKKFALRYLTASNRIEVNPKAISLPDLAIMLLELSRGGPYRDSAGFDAFIKVRPDSPGYLNHELEHVISSPDRYHEKGYDACGKMASFDACAGSRASRAQQNGILGKWREGVASLFDKYCSSRNGSEWSEALSRCKRVNDISPYELTKYLEIPILDTHSS